MARTRFDRNEIKILKNYALIFLYDRNQNIVGKTKIDLCDVERCKEHKWYLKKANGGKFYVQRRTGRLHLSHFISGFIKKRGWEVDHENGDSLDNRRNNLKIVTHQQNMMNQQKIPSNNTSGVMGVGWHGQNNNWVVQIKVNQKRIHIGSYAKKEDAIKARLDAEIKYFGNNKVKNRKYLRTKK
jgi:hypothetical protein